MPRAGTNAAPFDGQTGVLYETRVRPLAAATFSLAFLLPSGSRAETARPGIDVAVGMALSRDSTGMVDAETATIPAFYAMGGFGTGFLGGAFAVLATSAVGRFDAPNQPVDRITGELLFVLRPAANTFERRIDYGARVLRTIAIALGPGFEHLTTGRPSAARWGFRVGAHVDLPLGPPAHSEMRLRLGGRKFNAFRATTVGMINALDSQFELFAALAVVF